jgi:nucleotide-binding universal stress UspA family protein
VPGVVQRRTKLSGQWYDKGASVPEELVTGRNVASGLVVRSAPSDQDLAAELAATKAELAAALARLEEAGITLDGDADGQPFDPGEHKVDEVLAYVDANPDDLGRTLDAELGGKARKTLLDELERRQDEAAGAGEHPNPDDDGR